MYRAVLDSWVAARKSREFFKQTDTWVRWLEMPKPPVVVVPTFGPDGARTGTEMKSVRVVDRRDLVAMGTPHCNWERPASYELREALDR